MNCIDQGYVSDIWQSEGSWPVCFDPKTLVLWMSTWSFFQSTFSFIGSFDPTATQQGRHAAPIVVNENWGISVLAQVYKW